MQLSGICALSASETLCCFASYSIFDQPTVLHYLSALLLHYRSATGIVHVKIHIFPKPQELVVERKVVLSVLDLMVEKPRSAAAHSNIYSLDMQEEHWESAY